MHAKLGFDFYGLGNVGDDLMLAGFLEVWGGRKPLFGVVRSVQQRILRRRFPEVTWLTPTDPAPPHDLWLGVGDTPVQVLSGTWFLEHLERELLVSSMRDIPVLFIGIGVEHEAVRQRDRFRKVLERVSYISTRDEASAGCLSDEFDVPRDRISVGDDLANICLDRTMLPFYAEEVRPLDLALNYYSENGDRRQWWTVHRWLQERGRDRSVVILANECRMLPGSEAGRYAEMAWLFSLRRRMEPLPLLAPNRWAARISDMISHFSTVRTVMSSRYHCLLAAAWAGCRVVALSRSSKIEVLRSRLALSVSGGGRTGADLDAALAGARLVSREHLQAMSAGAASATSSALATCA